jgi:hypothetical protein
MSRPGVKDSHISFFAVILCSTVACEFLCDAFLVPMPSTLVSPTFLTLANKGSSNNCLTVCQSARRDILAQIGFTSLVLFPRIVCADEDNQDLTAKLFNPDGSLKEGVEAEAKERTVEFTWDASDDLSLYVDGANIGSTKKGSEVLLTYKLPSKWADGTGGSELYFDGSEVGGKACSGITVYQAPGLASLEELEKAATIGVAKALKVPDSLKLLFSGDVISARTSKKDGQKYLEFDMATAPKTCSDSKENLGLGFCPYDNIYLLSATILNDRLYVICVECNSTKIWKLASSDLKRVRSSLIVSKIA